MLLHGTTDIDLPKVRGKRVAFAKTLAFVLIVCAAAWSTEFMIGLWSMIATKPENIGHFGNFINGVGTLGLFGAAVYGSIFLSARFEQQRFKLARQEQHRALRFETAQKAYTAFIKANNAMRRIRSPVYSIPADKVELYKGDKGTALRTLDLLRDEMRHFEAIQEIEPMFVALFGDEKPFKEFIGCFMDVRYAASDLHWEAETLSPKERRELKRGKIWEDQSDRETINPRLDAALARIKEICLPELRQDH